MILLNNIIFSLVLQIAVTTASQQPNIILILTDDQGYYDVGYRGSDILTPHIDELAASGVKLENHYVQPTCTPSRSVLLTGRYQIHTGMQNGVLDTSTRFGIPLELPLLSEQLQNLGYATHLVGKWHLGYYKKDYTPTYRGFDTFFGSYNGAIDHYTKMMSGAYDMQSNEGDELNIAWNDTEYSTVTLANRVVDLINTHDQEQPMFVYLAFTAPHSPLQAPQEYLDKYSWVEDPDRQTYNAMITCLDDALKNITDALKDADMLDNTIIIYSSDNGGNIGEGASNWPLRGSKGSLFEGGIKSSAFVASTLLQSQGTVTYELIHISDWYPTLVHLAGGDVEGLDVDGFNQWETIAIKELALASVVSSGQLTTGLHFDAKNGQPSPREELLLNIDPLTDQVGENHYPDIFDVRVQAGIRVGDWKLLTGSIGRGTHGERPDLPSEDVGNTSFIRRETTNSGKRLEKRQETRNIQLYNLAEDPYEYEDVSGDNPDIVVQLLERLAVYNSTAWEAVDYQELSDPKYNPEDFGGAHFPWL